jgi:hypothetical protein
MVEKVICDAKLVALILRADYSHEGIKFFTPDNFSQQLAYLKRPQGYKIAPHIHNSVKREVFSTQEVLFLKSGKVKVDFYSDEQKIIESRIISTGDVLLLAAGGHGFTMIEESEIIEVKQGPYTGENDKTRF